MSLQRAVGLACSNVKLMSFSSLTLCMGSLIVGDFVTNTPTESRTFYNAVFEWKPRIEDARAMAYSLQWQGPANLRCSNSTFRIMVEKCHYCISDKDSFHTIAANFGTHWTQIWSSNPSIISPDYVKSGTLIALGNTFITRFGDTWKSLAVRFGTEYDMIRRLNPDIPFDVMSGSDIPAGQPVCIMPETCPTRRIRFPGITW